MFPPTNHVIHIRHQTGKQQGRVGRADDPHLQVVASGCLDCAIKSDWEEPTNALGVSESEDVDDLRDHTIS